jgi:hypothetical protein
MAFLKNFQGPIWELECSSFDDSFEMAPIQEHGQSRRAQAEQGNSKISLGSALSSPFTDFFLVSHPVGSRLCQGSRNMCVTQKARPE